MKSVIEMQTRRDFFQSAVGTFPFPLQTISLRLQQLDEVLLQMQTANQTKCCQMMQLHQLQHIHIPFGVFYPNLTTTHRLSQRLRKYILYLSFS